MKLRIFSKICLRQEQIHDAYFAKIYEILHFLKKEKDLFGSTLSSLPDWNSCLPIFLFFYNHIQSLKGLSPGK
jgi:hypothetical protein